MPGSMNTLLDDWADSKFQTYDDDLHDKFVVAELEHSNSEQCPLSAPSPSPASVMSDSDQRAYIDTAAREATRAETEKLEQDTDLMALRKWMANGADPRLGPGSSFLRAADGGKSSEYKEITGPGSTQRKLEYRKQWGSITYEKLKKKNITKRATRRWTLPKANT